HNQGVQTGPHKKTRVPNVERAKHCRRWGWRPKRTVRGIGKTVKKVKLKTNRQFPHHALALVVGWHPAALPCPGARVSSPPTRPGGGPASPGARHRRIARHFQAD